MHRLVEIVYIDLTDEKWDALVEVHEKNAIKTAVAGDMTCPKCGYPRVIWNPLYVGHHASCPRCDHEWEG